MGSEACVGQTRGEGSAGAVVMGLRHGLFCLGCFVAGVMNLACVAAIAGLAGGECSG